MMIRLTVLFLFFTSLASAQMISGDLKDSGREMVSPTSYIIEGNFNGNVNYELTVNIDGDVTSTRYVAEGSSIKSTPARVQVRNHVNKMKFQPGYHFPKFHKVVVKITIVKPIKIEN